MPKQFSAWFVGIILVSLVAAWLCLAADDAVPAAPASQPVYTLPPDQIKYAKGYPVIPNDIKAAAAAREAQWNRLDEQAWEKARPEAQAWIAKGRPLIEVSRKPSDLLQAKIPAFPGAEGGGMWTYGGRGGKVYVVTSLADSGPSTLREACEAGGPRIVVFNVAGIIHLDRPLVIRAPYLTIAGQTAPGDGICVAGRTTHVYAHDVVIRYMRFRRGITELADRDDALDGDTIGNVVVDHCSCSWGLDETLSIYRQMYSGDGPREKLPAVNVTIQWTIVSEGIDVYHHAFGATWGGINSMFAHNLFACNTGRNASIGMTYDFNFINNVIFNWRHRTLDGGDDKSLLNCINNYYKPGPVTNTNAVRYRIVLPQPKRVKANPDGSIPPRPFGKYYVAGNIMEGNDRVTADNWDGGVQFPEQTASANDLTEEDPGSAQSKALIAQVKLDKPLPMPPVTILSAKDAYSAVLENAGATLPKRDPVDVRIVNEVRTGEVTYKEGKGIITDISQVGGYPEYKGTPFVYPQNDGIPDWWKTKYGLKLDDPNLASADCNGDGYTNIEKYINGIDPTKKVDWTDLKNNVSSLTQEKLFAQ